MRIYASPAVRGLTNIRNFGDRLGPMIIKHMTDRDIEYVSASASNKILSVGSVLGRNKGNKKYCGHFRDGDVVWGSGSIRKRDIYIPKHARVYAVRGPLTRDCIKGKVPKVYGDPGLLLPEIIQVERSEKYEIGVIPHFKDKPHFIPQDDWLYIDTADDIVSFIEKVNSCKVIYSSALHGIITAEAYGIPCAWVRMIPDAYFFKKGEFKFRDYLASTGRDEDYSTWDNPKILSPPKINTEPLKEAWHLLERTWTHL